MAAKTNDNCAYFTEYWIREKDEQNKKRRNRYANDPEYAEERRIAARERRKKLREEELERRKTAGESLERNGGGPRKAQLVEVRGKMVEAFTIGCVADDIGKSVMTMNYWRKVGILPDSPFLMGRGDRLYTKSMIRIIKRAIEKREKVSKRDKSFPREIRRGWKRVGVPV